MTMLPLLTTLHTWKRLVCGRRMLCFPAFADGVELAGFFFFFVSTRRAYQSCIQSPFLDAT